MDSKLFQAFCGDLTAKACGTTPNHPKGLKFLGMDLGKAASDISGGFTDALPYFLLIALVVVTGYLQFKQTQSRQTAQANPQMAIMGKIFPVMFAFISYSLPSGVVLYFLVSNAWQIGQQALIFRTMPHRRPGGGAVAATGSAPKADGEARQRKPKPAETPEPAAGRAVQAGAAARPGRRAGAAASQAATETARRSPRRNGPRRPAAGGRGTAGWAGLNRRVPHPGPRSDVDSRQRHHNRWNGSSQPERPSPKRSKRPSTSWAWTRPISSTRCSRNPNAGS